MFNWEDLLKDDADLDKIIQIKQSEFSDEGVEEQLKVEYVS